MSNEQLWELRQEIVLGSLYLADYENSFGIDRDKVCTFFDGFLSYVEELMKEDIVDFDDAKFFDYLPSYDKPEYLAEWYGMFEEDPLPIPVEEREEVCA